MISKESIKKVIMGLDISTKTVGVTIATWDEVSEEPNILIVTHLRPKNINKAKNKTESLFIKSDIICKGLSEYVKFGITDIVIEEPMIGTNNAKTAASLLRFNGMISQSVYNIFGIVPEFISSYDARKYGCPQLFAVRKYKKDGTHYDKEKIIEFIKDNKIQLFGEYPFDCQKKYILWSMISERYPDIKWSYSDNGELKDENFDACDSLICVLGYIKSILYKDTAPSITLFTQDENCIEYCISFCGNSFTKTIQFQS